MTIPRRRLAVIVAAGITVLLVAIPVLGADPSAPASSSPSAETSPSTEPTSGSSPGSFAPSSEPSTEPSTEASPSTAASASPDAEPSPVMVDRSPESEKTAPGSEKEAGVPVTVTGIVVAGTDGKGRPTYTLTADGKTWELSDGPPWFWGDKNPLNAYVGKSVTVAGSAEAGGTELEVDTVNGTAIRAPGKPPWAGGPWVVGPTHPGWKPWMAGGKPGNGQNKDKTKDKAEDPSESEAPDSP